jgi:tetratricopeptide (TPR) repeat protein
VDVADVHTVADLAAILRTLRRREARRRGGRELTYRDLAARTGWSYSIIGEYLSGRTLPATDRFDTLVRLLGASPAEQGALATARDRVQESRLAGDPRWPVPRQLPADLPGFAGRATELAALADRSGSIIVLTGTAGVGKTALAVHWAHSILESFPDGQLYLDLRGFGPAKPTSAGEALGGFLSSLGVPPPRVPDDEQARAALYRSLLATKRVLVLLDNARTAEQVRPLLPGGPGCLAVVTSRSRLTGLSITDGARPCHVDPMSAADAADLIARWLGPERTAADPQSTQSIINACAGLPLALSIVSARGAAHPHLPLPWLVRELERARLDTLAADDVATDVRAALAWSYQALDPDAARAFRQLGVHPGADAPIDAIAAMAGLSDQDIRLAVASLISANLVTMPYVDRLSTHDLLRIYARELVSTVDTSRDHIAALERMLDHYLRSAHAAALLINPHREPLRPSPPAPPAPMPDHLAAVDWFSSEYAVLVAAIELAASAGLDSHAWRLTWTLTDFVDRQGRWRDFVRIEQIALQAAQRNDDLAACAYSHRLLGVAHLRLGDFDEARSHLDRALTAHTELGDHVGQASVHLNLGGMHEMRQRHPDALRHSELALGLYRQIAYRPGEARALNSIAWCHAQMGDYEQTIEHCTQALTLLSALGDLQAQAGARDTMGYAYHHLGRFADAAESFGQAIELFRDLGDRYYEADTLVHLGDTQQAAGLPDAARDSWHEALGILEELGHQKAEPLRAKLDAA